MFKKCFLVASTLLVLSNLAHAVNDSAENQGLKIAYKVDQKDSGWKDQVVNIRMELTDKSGNKSIRKVRNETLEIQDNGDKSLVIFESPKDVKGTVMLSFTHKVDDDDQWLYLSALKRVKRISSSNKSGPFMGSDFAYEDISSQEVEKYTYKYIRDEVLEGVKTQLIERIPVYKNSGYKRQLVWIHSDKYVPVKIDYFDRKNSLLKTLSYNGYQQYEGKFWRVDDLTMVNHQKNTKTVMAFDNYKLSTGLSERNFRQSSLKRTR